MIVSYDYQIFEHQIYGGISRYFYELIKGLEQHPDVSYSLPLKQSSNHYIKRIPSIANGIKSGSDYYNQFLFGTEFRGKWTLFQRWNQLFPQAVTANRRHAIEVFKSGAFDIFHPTDLSDYFLDYIGNKPFVVTIHDMIDEYFPEYSFHVHSNYQTSVKENLIKKAAGIIAVSESTKRDILHRFNVDEKKIKVIYHGVSELEDQHTDSRLIVDNYFLYVGKRAHYKNFYFFLQCIQSLLTKDRSLKIVCAGPPFNKIESTYFNDLGIVENLIHVDADDRVLGNLYQHALAFVYPSLYEGFGIPILEAFKFGCPVILSNSSSLPEVAGDAGIYFTPKDIGSVRQAVQLVMRDKALRTEIIQKGYARLQNFPLKKMVDQTVAFYKSIA